MASKLTLKNDINTEFSITHSDGEAAKSITSTELDTTISKVSLGVSGTFTTVDGKTITITNGIVTSIV